MAKTQTMDKCRICLGNKKNLMSIYYFDKDISYADMITSIANVKIQKDENIPDKLCRMCRRKLRESYDFKIMIERSDAALYEKANHKILNFSNINDVNTEIKIEIDCPQSTAKCDYMTEYFKDGVDEVCYSDTVIKKIETDPNKRVKPIPVLDFLKAIKEEPTDDDDFIDSNDNDNDHYGPEDSEYDDDYIPPSKLLKPENNKKKYKTTKVTIKNKSTKVNGQCKKAKDVQVRIKPVYLKDLKLIPTKVDRPKMPPKKQVYHARLQMCPHCGIMTKSLKSHMLQHTGERNFKCDQCEKAFFTAANLSNHMKNHTTTRDFKCDQCLAAFSQKSALKSHMVKHSGELKHICETCSKGFKRKVALRRHVIMHSSANKTVMCELCNMSFFNNYQLRHHMRVHTGERPYKCEICSQPYSYKHDFNRHCFKKHGIFLKRRSVFVMNEEVLKQEKALMRDLMLRVQGLVKDDKPLEAFDGPQGYMAFEQAVKALKSRQIPLDL